MVSFYSIMKLRYFGEKYRSSFDYRESWLFKFLAMFKYSVDSGHENNPLSINAVIYAGSSLKPLFIKHIVLLIPDLNSA